MRCAMSILWLVCTLSLGANALQWEHRRHLNDKIRTLEIDGSILQTALDWIAKRLPLQEIVGATAKDEPGGLMTDCISRKEPGLDLKFYFNQQQVTTTSCAIDIYSKRGYAHVWCPRTVEASVWKCVDELSQ
jgi:predicted RNA-binding Zn-ribbon protein involved in translation (DUF1610 family)